MRAGRGEWPRCRLRHGIVALLLLALHLPMSAESALTLSAEVEGRGANARLRVSFSSRSAQPILLLPSFETDAGTQHDNLLLDTGRSPQPLIAPRKSAAPRWCVLAAGASYSLQLPLTFWLEALRLPAPTGSTARIGYLVGSDSPPAAALVCGTSAGPLVSAPAWRGSLWSAAFALR